MRESQGSQAERRARARALAQESSVTEALTIQCSRGHHLARVLDTSDGPVIETRLTRRSHGRRDLHSDPHGVDEPTLWHDLLDPTGDPFVDDVIRAGCACGDYTLSRAQVIEWLSDPSPRVLLQ
jgi:hypothetical protein